MGLPIDRLSSRLPRRFPVGAKYVVEGYGGEEGKLRVIARYVVLPGADRKPPRQTVGQTIYRQSHDSLLCTNPRHALLCKIQDRTLCCVCIK